MSRSAEKLYGLLPAIYRLRDAERGHPLRALIEVLAEQVAVVEEDLAQLYDDQFIETCAEWLVPYLGELVGQRALHGVTRATLTTRAEVANTIAYRRRKGTASVLEQLARDVTGHDARAVECFRLVAATQWLNHLRPEHRAVTALRPAAEILRLRTPFSAIPRTLEVRRIGGGRGRYNLPNVAFYLWRLRAFPVTRAIAKKLKAGAYTFHPLGVDAPLFTPGRAEEALTQVLGPENAPGPLDRRTLYAELHGLRQAIADGEPAEAAARRLLYFAHSRPVIRIEKRGTPIPPAEVLICDLSEFSRPPQKLAYTPRGKPKGPAVELPIQVAVDPVLGRLAFPTGVPLGEADVVVSYSYGAPGGYGGGPYERSDRDGVPATLVVSKDLSLADALGKLGTASGVIEVPNSATLIGDLKLALAAGQRLTLRAGRGARPVLIGLIEVTAAEGTELVLEGVLLARAIAIRGSARMALALRHSTVPPSIELEAGGGVKPRTLPALRWDAPAAQGRLTLDHTVSGRLLVGEGVEVGLSDSWIDAGGDDRIALAASEDGTSPAGPLDCRRSTVIGRVRVRLLALAENSLYTGGVIAERCQEGCLRFCFLPEGSRVPRRYRCEPDLAVSRALEAARRARPATADEAALVARIRSRVKPMFASLRYGDPDYGRLHRACPREIREGAEDGAELGVFHDLFEPQRERNLTARIDEYLTFGLEAGVFYVT